MYVNPYSEDMYPAHRPTHPTRRPTHPANRRRRSRRRKQRMLQLLQMLFNILLLAAIGIGIFLLIDSIGAKGDTVVDFTEGNGVTQAQTWDTTAPEIFGIRDHTVYAGDTVSYREGIVVTDDLDEAPELTVDSSGVNLSRAGTYQVHYTVTDSAGNSRTAAANITVMEKQEGFAELEIIYTAADTVLAQILVEGMSTSEQAKSIYDWARQTLHYGGHSTRSDYYQAAYEMLTTGKGDCYGYFAVTKLMFERLGIPNIDVRKVKNSDDDSDHFWSLVSVDGGNSYYHFDATPRIGEGADFFMVTDSYLDDYSDANNGSHNRDKSLYPQTPED